MSQKLNNDLKMITMRKLVKYILGLFFLLVFASFFFGNGIDEAVNIEMKKIEKSIAIDAIKQYEIAKKNGSAMDAYVQAGVVAAAFLQANDEENYKKWKSIEKSEGKRLGISN